MSNRNVVMRDEVLPLEALRRDDLKRGGGKGANLGKLMAVCDTPGYACAIPSLLTRMSGRYRTLSTSHARPRR